MQQLFISYVKEDEAHAVKLAGALEQRGFTVWYYKRDSVPGPSYLKQVIAAIAESEGVILIVSRVSMDSHIVDAEVYRAFETRKRFVPLLSGVTHDELEERMPEWVTMFRAATTIPIPPTGVSAILAQIEKGVRMMGIEPARDRPLPDAAWTVFARPECSPGDTTLVQVWLHPAGQEKEVEARAQAADSGAVRRAGGILDQGIGRDERLVASLSVSGVEIIEPRVELAWRGGAESAEFAVSIPEGSPPTNRVGKAELSLGDTPLTSLRFVLKVTPFPLAEGAKPSAILHEGGPSLRRYRQAFVSYAARDQAEVSRRLKMLSMLRIPFFAELKDFSRGEDWAAQVKRNIDEADVFFLFWSQAASSSEWVRHELRYALNRKQGDPERPPAIIPILLETPGPPPPPELAGYHFLDSMAYLVASGAK